MKAKELITGNDGRYSLRRILAIFAFLGIMDCTHYGIRHGIAVEVVGLVGVLAGLVTAMLGLTTIQSIKEKNDTVNKEL